MLKKVLYSVLTGRRRVSVNSIVKLDILLYGGNRLELADNSRAFKVGCTLEDVFFLSVYKDRYNSGSDSSRLAKYSS
jgi:hypothetical protein